MRIHFFQHEPFEQPGILLNWAQQQKDTQISFTYFFKPYSQIPPANAFDMLIILGGSMGAYDDDIYPWMSDEKKCIEKAIQLQKKVLGICLGAQLIATVLGAKVYKNKYTEIGWFPLTLHPNAITYPPFSHFPATFTAMHWHGDTFDLPDGCKLLASSQGCAHQAFAYLHHVLAFQYHPEMTAESIQSMLDTDVPTKDDTFIQTKSDIVRNVGYAAQNHQLLYNALESFVAL